MNQLRLEPSWASIPDRIFRRVSPPRTVPLPDRRPPLWVAILLALGAGPVLDAAFPALGIWPLSFLGVGMILAAVRGRGFWAGTGLGFLAGLGFYLSHVSWTALYLGPVPWSALSVLQAIFFALGCGLIALAYRLVPRAFPTRGARLALLPVVIAGLWVARESVSGSWPYGGFAWGRLAYAHSESPLAELTSWIGVAGVSFIVAWIAALGYQLLVEGALSSPRRLLAPAALVLAVALVPLAATPQVGVSRIAAVQGNGPAGYFDERTPGDVLGAQSSTTMEVLGRGVDMVVWPENGSDLDPMTNPVASGTLNYLTGLLQAPIITGAITTRGSEFFNSSLLWMPEVGPADYYDKARPVPFGEYVPDRPFWRSLAPDLIDMIGRDYTPGTRDNVFDVNGTIAAVSLCFDIVDDGLLRDGVNRGAQVILAQTNNADFGKTKENQQQLAMARMRAIETGRALVNISTVGTSQTIDADGATLATIEPYEPGVMIVNVPLHSGITPGVRFGEGIQWLASGLGLGGLLVAVRLTRAPRRASATAASAQA